MHTLSVEDMQRLVAAAKGHQLEALIMLALTTGLRRGELLALRWQDIELEQGTLLVRRAVDGAGELAEPKMGIRTFVLPSLLISILQQHRQRQDAEKQAQGSTGEEGDLVFAGPSGSLLDAVSLRRSFAAIAARAEISPVSFHTLRHTACFFMLEAGIPPAVVQAILGMRRIASPLAHLSPISLSLLREAAAKLDALFRTLVPAAASERSPDGGRG